MEKTNNRELEIEQFQDIINRLHDLYWTLLCLSSSSFDEVDTINIGAILRFIAKSLQGIEYDLNSVSQKILNNG